MTTLEISCPVIGVDARWLLGEKVEPHAALLKALMTRNRMRPYDAQFVLYTDASGFESDLAVPPNVTVRVVQPGRQHLRKAPDEWWVNVSLAKAVRTDRVDLFFSPYYKVPLPLNVPRINMVHDLSFFVLPSELSTDRYRSKLQRWRLARFMRAYCAAANCTVTVSNYSKACLEKFLGLGPDRIRVCPNGVDLDLMIAVDDHLAAGLRARYCLPEQYLLFVGSNIRKKNLEGLLAAYARLPKEQRARAALVLKTARGALEQYAKDLDVFESVIFVEDRLSDPEMATLIGGARAVVLLSFDEGFGIPVAEAMAAGVPVVVSKGGALEEIVGDSAMLVDPSNANEGAKALNVILTASNEEYRRMSEACRARAQTFSAVHAADRLFNVMREAAASTIAAGVRARVGSATSSVT